MTGYPREYGRYVLLERIGVGGMSQVDLARRAVDDASFVRFTVIKRIAPANVTDESFLRMFMDEARINAELQHANIAQVYDFGKLMDTATGNPEFFLVMEYVPGMDLRQLQRTAMEKGWPIPLRLTFSVLMEVLDALQHAHTRSDTLGRPMHIVHRDINPRNVMLSIRGEVKVIDFGVAFAADRLEKTQGPSLKGKFAYMAPEQIEGNVALDGRADLYAVGLMLHELVSGRHPFAQLTELQIMHRILTGQIPPMEIPPDYPNPPLLQGVLQRALATDRDYRYPDADAFRRDLERAAAVIGGPARPDERAAFLRELDPERMDNIQTRLRRYKESSFPMVDSLVDGDLPREGSVSRIGAPVNPDATRAYGAPTGSYVVAPPPARSSIVPILLIVVGIALITIALVTFWYLGRMPMQRIVEVRSEPSLADMMKTPSTDEAVAAPGEAVEEPAGSGSSAPGVRNSAVQGGTAGPTATSTGAPTTPVGPGPGTAARTGAPDGGAAPPTAATSPTATSPSTASPPPVAPPPTSTSTTPPVAETAPPADPNAGASASGAAATGETGSVMISSRPVNLEVFVDGKPVGRTILRNLKLPAGKHTVVIRYADGNEFSTTVDVKARQVVTVAHVFEEGTSNGGNQNRR